MQVNECKRFSPKLLDTVNSKCYSDLGRLPVCYSHKKSAPGNLLCSCYANIYLKNNSKLPCFKVFGVLGNLGKLGPSALIFLKLSNFIILRYGVLNFLSRMGSINSFSQAVQEILLNNYLESNFENWEIRDFVSTFWNFIREKSSLKKSLLFWTLNANVWRTAYHRKINEPILKSFY